MKIFFKQLIFRIKLVFSRYYYSNYKEGKNIGVSLKDLGKRWFSFNKMEMTAKELLGRI